MNDENQKKADIALDKEFRLADDFSVPTFEEWKEKVIADLKGAPYEKKLITKTYEGIDLQPIYTIDDLKKLKVSDSFPGFSRFLRGMKPSEKVTEGWFISQEIPYGSAKEWNEAVRNDLARGQNAIAITLDHATQLGIDPDQAEVGEVAAGALSVAVLKNLEHLFMGIDVLQYPVYVSAGFSALPFIAMLKAWFGLNNLDMSKLRGSVEANPLSFKAVNGKLPVSLSDAFDEMYVAAKWASENTPQLKTIGVSGIPYNSAGASAVQELAFVMSAAVEYIEQMKQRGLTPLETHHSMRFSFGIGTNFFMEIAKLRAARTIFDTILEAYEIPEEERTMHIHGRTSTYTQTKYDPYVNMLRTTTEAFAAAAGGADSLHTNHFDELFGEPNTFSRRIARNTQIILKEESHSNQVIDPAGGSYYVESLTKELAGKAWELFKEIDKLGGLSEALDKGVPQKMIAETHQARLNDVKKRKAVIVGTNMYANAAEKPIEPVKPDLQQRYDEKADYVKRYRVAGDDEKHRGILEKLQQLLDKSAAGVVDAMSDAFIQGAAIGEISRAMRAAAKEPAECEVLQLRRMSEPFEELRDAAAAYKKEKGSAPKVFLATMGQLKQYKARADFSTGFFEAGGFEVVYPKGFDEPDTAVAAAIDAGADAVVICSTDETYPELVPPLVNLLKSKKPGISVILAGYPKDQIDLHKENGVDDFIFLGCNAYDVLSKLMKKIGAMS